MTNYIRFA